MTPKFFTSAAAEAGHKAGLAVLAGRMTAEKAGDKWVAFADKSHGQGVAFLREFDATGAQR
jgi:hypothetical protein